VNAAAAAAVAVATKYHDIMLTKRA